MFRRPHRRLVLPAEVMRFAVSELVWALGAAFCWLRNRVQYTCCLWPSHKIPAVVSFSLTPQGHENMRFKPVEAIWCHSHFLWWCIQSTPDVHPTQTLSPNPLSSISKPLLVWVCVYLKDCSGIVIDAQGMSIRNVGKLPCTYPQNCLWRRRSQSTLAQRPSKSGAYS